MTEVMVSETTLPERRAGLRPISRPSQMAFGVAILAVVLIFVFVARPITEPLTVTNKNPK